jgi:Zn-dependent protease/predicted transcriptional regulator
MTQSNPALFRLFGFEVRLDASWLLLALLITWTLAAGLFPSSYPNLPAKTYWWMGIACALGILFSIVFHELSHSLMARRFGLPIKGITLFIFGGVAETAEEPTSPKSEFLIAVVGPLASILLAFIFRMIYGLAQMGGWYVSIVGVMDYLSTVNLVLAVFNLVPAFPLDGGRMLRAGLWHWRHDLRGATRIASQIGSGFGLVLMVLGGFAVLQGNFIGGMWWFLIGLFLRGAAMGSYRQLIVREVLSGQPIRRFMNPDPVVVPPSITIQKLVDDYIYKHHYKLFPVVEDSRLLGCITVQEVKQVPQEDWARRKVGELTNPCAPTNTVSADTDTTQVLTAMMRPGAATRLMVVEQGRLAGIVSFKDLREFIALKLELEQPR